MVRCVLSWSITFLAEEKASAFGLAFSSAKNVVLLGLYPIRATLQFELVQDSS